LAVTTNQVRRLYRAFLAVLEAGGVFQLAQHKLWPLALLLVAAVELWALRPGGGVPSSERRAILLQRALPLAAGVAASFVIAASLRLAAQVVVAGLYAVWRSLWRPDLDTRAHGMIHLLLVEAGLFEGLFLIAAMPTWHIPEFVVLVLVWLAAFGPVYAVLYRRGERAAGVMAATWGVVAVEIAWVLELWLFTYTSSGGYLLVPQPALILSALAYCFGSIYLSQRQGSLSRGRLTEYLLIGLILIAIVITGTPWRGSI
jgi:hypothetical protein